MKLEMSNFSCRCCTVTQCVSVVSVGVVRHPRHRPLHLWQATEDVQRTHDRCSAIFDGSRNRSMSQSGRSKGIDSSARSCVHTISIQSSACVQYDHSLSFSVGCGRCVQQTPQGPTSPGSTACTKAVLPPAQGTSVEQGQGIMHTFNHFLWNYLRTC